MDLDQVAVLHQGDWAAVKCLRCQVADRRTLGPAPGGRPFDLTGRPMKGWLLVDADGHAEDQYLRRWVGRGVA